MFLKDKAGVLINANEGNTKSLRQWRFTLGNHIDEQLVLKYINEAIGIENEGLTIETGKKRQYLIFAGATG